MNGNKLIAVSWWTFTYVVLAGALFAFSPLGDCLQAAEGIACRAQSRTITNALLVAAPLVYAALTWVMFFRRR